MVWYEQHHATIDFEEINISPNQSSFTQISSSEFPEYAPTDSAIEEDIKPKLGTSDFF